LARLAEIIRRDLGVDVEQLPGAGAAGGLGAGLVAFAGARLRPGAEMVMETLKLDQPLQGADLVITGEGRLDSQTARFGKGAAAGADRQAAVAAGLTSNQCRIGTTTSTSTAMTMTPSPMCTGCSRSSSTRTAPTAPTGTATPTSS